MSNPLKGLGTLTIAGFIGYAWLTSGNTPRQQMQAPYMQSAAAKSEPKLPALPIAETSSPSMMPEIMKRLARAEERSKPKFDAKGRQIFDFSPIPIIPQANSKTDLLGFYIGMPRAEVDAQFDTLGCKPSQERGSGIYTHELECKFAQGERLKMLLVKGLVEGKETEVIKTVELIFDSNDGALQMIDSVSKQFRSLPEFFDGDVDIRRVKYCTPGKRPEYSCSQGELARWPLTKQVELSLTLNSVADDERRKPDSYWLQMKFEPFKELEAEKAYKDSLAQKRSNIPAPRF